MVKMQGFYEAAVSSLVFIQILGVVTGQQCSQEGTVRLADGVSADESRVYGRVEICIDQQWGTVCDDGWDANEARVVCSQLGPFELALTFPEYGGGSGQIHYFSCGGDETSLLDCSQELDVTYCSHYEDVGVICYSDAECNETEIRLVDGVSASEGRVEICLNGAWGSVCDDSWGLRDAEVVCRQLGYNGTYIPVMSHPVLSVNLLFYHLDEVECTGNEIMLSDCAHGGIGVHDCFERFEEAGVICGDTLQCAEGDVRLVEGTTPDDGQVEICVYGVWGSVCDTRWDYRDAEVVCRQLHYDGPSYPLLNHNGNFPTTYHLDDVHCEGIEGTLSECTNLGIGVHNCSSYYEAAGVICTNMTCTEGVVHLVGGDDVSRGRVEYCYNGTWHSVCANDWDTTGEEARTVCQTLDLGYDTSYYASVVVNYGRGTSPILPLNIQCASGTSTFSDCSTTELDVSQCTHVAGVDCFAPCTTEDLIDCNQCSGGDSCISYYGCRCSSDCFFYGECCSDISVAQNCFVEECEHGAVRLVGGPTNSTGRLEFCALGVWGSVCNAFGYWGPENAKVVCRQLGFSEDGAYIQTNDIERFGTSIRDAVIGKVHCVGNEMGLLECSHSRIGFHYCSPYYIEYNEPDIVISCYGQLQTLTRDIPSHDR